MINAYIYCMLAHDHLQIRAGEKVHIISMFVSGQIKEDAVFEWIKSMEQDIKHCSSAVTVAKLKELVDTFKSPEEINEIAG